jgi:hypothetical protein
VPALPDLQAGSPEFKLQSHQKKKKKKNQILQILVKTDIKTD